MRPQTLLHIVLLVLIVGIGGYAIHQSVVLGKSQMAVECMQQGFTIIDDTVYACTASRVDRGTTSEAAETNKANSEAPAPTEAPNNDNLLTNPDGTVFPPDKPDRRPGEGPSRTSA
jgi:hypothetical protein